MQKNEQGLSSNLAVSLEMLANGYSLLDQTVEVLRDVGCKSKGFQDTKDFVASNMTNLSNTMRISKNYTCRDENRSM